MNTNTNPMQATDFHAEDLIDRLISDFGYTLDRAPSVARKINAFPLALKSSFWKWWQTGILDEDLQVEGFTIGWLIRSRGMKPIAAFLALDWLSRDPEKARATISRGYDTIIPPRKKEQPKVDAARVHALRDKPQGYDTQS